ncbi:hypothetical protein CCHR01_08673 [Colletotrichum chrysophilum]|uniref:Transmembrane protein n=1 Tax=Colletotrichum chrysophilum TaxID=1836956 RepID=A0AAD9EHI7_9PEZI|nr:hypothetical protein CCHR01_08673 [Colletotrichum chrysophilum]
MPYLQLGSLPIPPQQQNLNSPGFMTFFLPITFFQSRVSFLNLLGSFYRHFKMSSFKSKRGHYKAVRRDESRVSSSTNDEERQIPDDPPPIKTVEDELEALRRKVRRLRTSVALLVATLAMTLIFFLLYVQLATGSARYVLLGQYGL